MRINPRGTAFEDGRATDGDREQRRYERAHDPSRVLVLSDGVCAIIITLLVLEVDVPDRIRRAKRSFKSCRPSGPQSSHS